MTLEHKTPKARKEARSYCRRCLVVMLCCVLAFGMTVRTAPRAQANAAVETISLIGSGGGAGAAGALATNPVGATIGGLLLVAAGVPFAAGYVQNKDSILYDTAFYRLGDDCYQALYDAGPEFAGWLLDVTGYYENKGGISAGDSLTVPASVAEAARAWALSNLNFTDGQLDLTNRLLVVDGQQIVLTEKPSSIGYGWYKDLANLSSSGIQFGSLYNFVTSPRFSLGGTTSDDWQWEYSLVDLDPASVLGNTALLPFGEFRYFRDGTKIWSYGKNSHSYAFFWVDEYRGTKYLVPGFFDSEYGVLFTGDCRGKWLPTSDSVIAKVTTTLTKTPALDEEKTQDMAVTVPADIPTTQVGGVTVPVVGALAPEDVLDGAGTGEQDKPVPDATPWGKILESLDGIGAKVGALPQDIAGAVTDALPITGSIAGDQTVEEAMTEPDSLGALMITKFPFSIPWDIYKAIKLLAAPPVTPRWEVDFMAPLADNVGGFPGDTTVIIDFSEYEIVGIVTRWTSTVMFIYALASGTKRLLWTA